jgi:hypothetical protein
VFENRVLRSIFGSKRDEVTVEWRKLHNEELHILYSSPNIIRQIKSRRTRWAGHVARMGEEITHTHTFIYIYIYIRIHHVLFICVNLMILCKVQNKPAFHYRHISINHPEKRHR